MLSQFTPSLDTVSTPMEDLLLPFDAHCYLLPPAFQSAASPVDQIRFSDSFVKEPWLHLTDCATAIEDPKLQPRNLRCLKFEWMPMLANWRLRHAVIYTRNRISPRSIVRSPQGAAELETEGGQNRFSSKAWLSNSQSHEWFLGLHKTD